MIDQLHKIIIPDANYHIILKSRDIQSLDQISIKQHQYHSATDYQFRMVHMVRIHYTSLTAYHNKL